MGRPTSEAKVAFGKLSPEKPIFIYPVPGSHMIEGLFFISRFLFIYFWIYIYLLTKNINTE